jgi:hypothetical protein
MIDTRGLHHRLSGPVRHIDLSIGLVAKAHLMERHELPALEGPLVGLRKLPYIFKRRDMLGREVGDNRHHIVAGQPVQTPTVVGKHRRHAIPRLHAVDRSLAEHGDDDTAGRDPNRLGRFVR